MQEINITITDKPSERLVITRKSEELLSVIRKVFAFLAAYVIIFGNGGWAYVPSGSMEPTLQIGSLLLYRYTSAEDLSYDDIVLFFPEAELDGPVKNGLEALSLSQIKKEVIYVKRVIGLPGDVLEMKDGYVYRNGERLDPDYIAEPMATNGRTYTVPEDHIFCMGDNRNDSYDSRYIGSIPANNFYGKVIAVF